MKTPIQKFQERRFGLFLHWGLYSAPGGHWNGGKMRYIGEWIQSSFQIPNEEYAKLAETFNPDHFNADEWIRLACNAGIKYIVYTAKHHDGFAMYHSRVSPFNIHDATPFQRDPLKELAVACEKYGVELGIYYSHNLDWKDPDAQDPGADYPKNAGYMSWGNDWDFPNTSEKVFERYFRRKCVPQLTELLSRYGKVCELWFDCPIKLAPEYSSELRDLVHSLQPECVINSRIGNDCGDFLSLGDNQNMQEKSKVPVESPITLNDTWGFKHDDHNWKSAQHIAERLAALADRNANLLLNIGPMATGEFPAPSIKILKDLAVWNKQNPDVISGTEPNPFPCPFQWGFCTRKASRLNLFVRDWNPPIHLFGIRTKAISASVPFEQNEDELILHPGVRPDTLLPVIHIDFETEPQIDQNLTIRKDPLALPPCAGKIRIGKENAASETRVRLDVAAEIQKNTAHMEIIKDGSVANWQNPSDQIEWDLSFQTPGTYRVEAVTTQTWHGFQWIGSRTVEINWNNGKQILSGTLENPVEIPTPCYATGSVCIGSIRIDAPERGTLAFRTTGFRETEGLYSMNFLRLLISKTDD